jgi:hypothetical protein
VITEIGLRSPQYWHFLMRALHQLAVPDEAKQEDETKSGNKCDEEFFPVHNFFPLRFGRIPTGPKRSSQNASAVSISNFK